MLVWLDSTLCVLCLHAWMVSLLVDVGGDDHVDPLISTLLPYVVSNQMPSHTQQEVAMGLASSTTCRSHGPCCHPAPNLRSWLDRLIDAAAGNVPMITGTNSLLVIYLVSRADWFNSSRLARRRTITPGRKPCGGDRRN